MTTVADEPALGETTVHEHRTERGELRIWFPAPKVVVYKYKGHSDASYVDFLEDVIERRYGRQTGLYFFVDCEEQTGYDTAFRRRIVEWAKRVHDQTIRYDLLVKSRFVALGATLSNLAVGGHTTVTTSREKFRSRLQAAVDDELAQAPRRPT